MSDLVAIVYPTEAKAEEMRQKLLSLQKVYLIEISDAVIAVKDEGGDVKFNQLISTTSVGALSGGFLGAVIGMIFLMPVLGAALGAASGAALTDHGIKDDFMKELAGNLQPGSAALFVRIRKMTSDKLLDAIKGTLELWSSKLRWITARSRRCGKPSPRQLPCLHRDCPPQVWPTLTGEKAVCAIGVVRSRKGVGISKSLGNCG
jgi:uncharacterized membrane protein